MPTSAWAWSRPMPTQTWAWHPNSQPSRCNRLPVGLNILWLTVAKDQNSTATGERASARNRCTIRLSPRGSVNALDDSHPVAHHRFRVDMGSASVQCRCPVLRVEDPAIAGEALL